MLKILILSFSLAYSQASLDDIESQNLSEIKKPQNELLRKKHYS